MKKIIALLIAVATLGLVACAKESQEETTDESSIAEETSATSLIEATLPEDTTVSEQETISASAENRVLVVYFSVTGNTKNVAEMIATVTDADIYEIVPAIEYTDADIDYGNSDSRTSIEQNDSSMRPEIKSENIALEGYDTIYIGYPIWWGAEPRIMDTFVESYNFGDITMIPFCTSASSGMGNSGDNLASNAGSGNWIDGQRFDADVSMDEIEDWVAKLDDEYNLGEQG